MANHNQIVAIIFAYNTVHYLKCKDPDVDKLYFHDYCKNKIK